MPAISDSEIIQSFGVPEKKEWAFNQLILKYQERLYWHCRKIVISHQDSDDALQNTLLKVWQNLGDFRSESGLYTWLYRIATNESLTLLKSKKKHANGGDKAEYEQYMAESLTADPYFNGDEIQQNFQKAILSLPEKQRLVFNMKYFDDMKYEKISEILNTSTGALKASYHHAVKKIEKYFKEGE